MAIPVGAVEFNDYSLIRMQAPLTKQEKEVYFGKLYEKYAPGYPPPPPLRTIVF
jgi:hypothetical protein